MTSSYRLGGYGVGASAVLHLAAPLVGGVSSQALTLVPIGVVYLAVVAGLMRGFRWLAYLAFLGMLAGAIIALSAVWDISPVPGWWMGLIAGMNGCAALLLMAALWRAR